MHRNIYKTNGKEQKHLQFNDLKSSIVNKTIVNERCCYETSIFK
jgi:hypothetical protein